MLQCQIHARYELLASLSAPVKYVGISGGLKQIYADEPSVAMTRIDINPAQYLVRQVMAH